MVNERVKAPFKVATALTLALMIALALGWDRPYWAGFAVCVLAITETSSHSLKKGIHRLLGTLCGVSVAFLLAGLFPQQQFPFLLSYTLVISLCVYKQTNPKNGYIWTLTIFVLTVILVMGRPSSAQLFDLAMLRLQETALGVICFTLVNSLLWPNTGQKQLKEALKNYYENQHTQLQHWQDNTAQCMHPYNLGDELKHLARLRDLTSVAQYNSYHVNNTQAHWDQYITDMESWVQQCSYLNELIALLHGSLSEENQHIIRQYALHLQQRTQYVENQLKQIPQDQIPAHQLITLLEQETTPQAQQDELQMLAAQLTHLDALHYQLVHTLTAALNEDQPRPIRLRPLASTTHSNSQTRNIDPERAINALKIFIILWICIGLWLYIPMTGGAMIVIGGAMFGGSVLMMPFVNASELLRLMLKWSALMLAQYVLILPQLTEVWQLGTFYFVNAFAISYFFNQPAQVLHRLVGTFLLVLMTNDALKLHPLFDIRKELLELTLLTIAMLIIFCVSEGVFSGRAEHIFRRTFKRAGKGICDELAALCIEHPAHQGIAIKSPPMHALLQADTASQRIDYAAFANIEKNQITEVLQEAYKVCMHLQTLNDQLAQWRLTEQPNKHQQERYLTKQLTRQIMRVATAFNLQPPSCQGVRVHLSEPAYVSEHDEHTHPVIMSLQILDVRITSLIQNMATFSPCQLRLSQFSLYQ